jgi:hypothetical protein
MILNSNLFIQQQESAVPYKFRTVSKSTWHIEHGEQVQRGKFGNVKWSLYSSFHCIKQTENTNKNKNNGKERNA